MITLRRALMASLPAVTLALHVAPLQAEVSCGASLTADTVLEGDLTCPADGLKIVAGGVTLDCGGHAIRGSGAGGATGVLVSGVSGVTITGCRISGFATTIRGVDSSDLGITRSTLIGWPGGIRCTRCDRVAIEGNRIEEHLAQIDLLESPDARILGNVMGPHARGGGYISLRNSPRAWISGNRAPQGGGSMWLSYSDGSVIEDNDLARNASIQLWNSHGCRISRNTLVRGEGPQPDTGGMVRLAGSRGTLVQENRIEGGVGMLFSDGNRGGPEDLFPGANRNVIEHNLISDSGFGIVLLGASENRISGNRIERTEIGLAIVGQIDPDSDWDVPSDGNIVEKNTIQEGLFGIETWRVSGNRIRDNEILDHRLGAIEGPAGPFSMTPNAWSGNSFAGNGLFGMLALGSAPVIQRNTFSGNGLYDSPPDSLEPFLSLLGEIRGGIALLPVAGDDATLDNGDPGDDLPALPVIGGPGGRNLFEDNGPVDIYALDARPANASSLERDNHFKGKEGLRIRQDWFGLVRVEDSDGQPVAGAEVEVRDAAGATAAAFTTDASGIGPSGADPGRSQGRTLLEDGGRVPPWPRFTAFTVDARGRHAVLTPHTIVVDAAGEPGCLVHAWNGDPGETGGTRSPDGRYQVAIVRPGATCATPGSGQRPPR